MLLKNIFEDRNSFITDTQTKSYLDLIMKCLMDSSRAITNYLATSPEQHNEMRNNVVRTLQRNDQDAYADMRDIVDALKADGFITSLNEVRIARTFFQVVDQAIRSKRRQDL